MGSGVELLIHDLQVKVAGDYNCDSGDVKTMAFLVVRGEKICHFTF